MHRKNCKTVILQSIWELAPWHTRGDSPQTEIIFWKAGPLEYRLPLLRECSRNPSVSVYKLALLWEAAFSFSAFFLRISQCICPFHDGWFMSAPAHTRLNVQKFLTKNSMTPMLHPPYSPDLALSDLFFVSLVEKCPQGKCFANAEEMKQTNKQNGRSTKRHRNQWVQRLFWAVGKSLNRYIDQMESTLKVTKV